MVALLRPGPPAERAYRRTVHIRQNSDRILSSMRSPRARARGCAIPVGKCAGWPWWRLFQKMTFDAWPDAGLLDALPDRRDLVVAGCKTHVGVLQTALGLPAAGRRVCLVRDAVGSRRAESKETAIRRLERDGLSPQRAYRRTEAVEACGQWCDVVSFNLYERSIADDHDEWARFHALGKPALIGELHLSPPKMFCLVRPGYLVVLLVQHTGSGGSEMAQPRKMGWRSPGGKLCCGA